ERRGEGFGAAVVLVGAVPVSRAASLHQTDVRRVRPATDVLGYGPHAFVLLVPSGDHAVHRGAAVAVGERPGARHGPRRVRVARVAAHLIGSPQRGGNGTA